MNQLVTRGDHRGYTLERLSEVQANVPWGVACDESARILLLLFGGAPRSGAFSFCVVNGDTRPHTSACAISGWQTARIA